MLPASPASAWQPRADPLCEGVSAVVNVVLLPMAFLSGSFGPREEYPAFLNAIADVLPLTYFLDIVNGVYLDGESLFADPDGSCDRRRVGRRGARGRAPSFQLDAARALRNEVGQTPWGLTPPVFLAVREEREVVQEHRNCSEAPATYVHDAALRTLFTPPASVVATIPMSLSWRFARREASNSTGSVTSWKRTANA